MDPLFALGKLALTALLVVAALAYLLQERLIFYPQRLSAARQAELLARYPAVRELTLDASDGTRLHGWLHPGTTGAPLVLYFGGNAEEVSWMLEEIPRRMPQAAWLLTDYRGYGASAGSASERTFTADALAWYDYGTRLHSGPVYAFGRSLGSGVAVALAASRPLAGLVLVAPFDSLVDVGRHYYPFLPVQWMLRQRFDSASLAPAVHAPLLCLVAGSDQVIPLRHSRRLYDAWAGAKRWVALEGAGHNSTDAAPAFWREVRGFISVERVQ